MLIRENYLPVVLTCWILIHFIQTPSLAKKNHTYPPCKPSACGNIHTISYPFRLKDDPEYCGHHNRSFEISCEKNTTASVYIDSYKYQVRAINYQNYTIRLADPSIKNNDSCSFPTYSPNWIELVDSSYSSAYRVSTNSYRNGELMWSGMVWPVTFLSCPFPLNDTLFVGTNHCVPLSFNTSIIQRHTYVKAGGLNPRDIKDMCRIDLVVMSSSPFIYKDGKNDMSVLEILESLRYGFELSWFELCQEEGYCLSCDFSLRVVADDLYGRIFSYFNHFGLRMWNDLLEGLMLLQELGKICEKQNTKKTIIRDRMIVLE